jgi:saccharopine dehydrogenase (NAD+, L-lysine-forming)
LKIDAIGKKNGKLKRVETFFYHEDGYMFTAIPVVACLLQYFDGSIKKPGLWTMGNIVEPNRLVMDMERMGVKVWSEEREEKENK